LSDDYQVPGYGLAPMPQGDIKSVTVKLSYYWPPLGGINCDVIDGREECETMASGEPFLPYVGRALACPDDFDIGTTFCIDQLGCWVCRDRGGAIVKDPKSGAYWVDLLYPYMPGGTYWSEERLADVIE
jgi:hypothetical protein